MMININEYTLDKINDYQRHPVPEGKSPCAQVLHTLSL